MTTTPPTPGMSGQSQSSGAAQAAGVTPPYEGTAHTNTSLTPEPVAPAIDTHTTGDRGIDPSELRAKADELVAPVRSKVSELSDKGFDFLATPEGKRMAKYAAAGGGIAMLIPGVNIIAGAVAGAGFLFARKYLKK